MDRDPVGDAVAPHIFAEERERDLLRFDADERRLGEAPRQVQKHRPNPAAEIQHASGPGTRGRRNPGRDDIVA